MSSKALKLLDRTSFQIKPAFWFGYGKLNCSPVELLSSGTGEPNGEKGCPKIWKIVCYLNEANASGLRALAVENQVLVQLQLMLFAPFS